MTTNKARNQEARALVVLLRRDRGTIISLSISQRWWRAQATQGVMRRRVAASEWGLACDRCKQSSLQSVNSRLVFWKSYLFRVGKGDFQIVQPNRIVKINK